MGRRLLGSVMVISLGLGFSSCENEVTVSLRLVVPDGVSADTFRYEVRVRRGTGLECPQSVREIIDERLPGVYVDTQMFRAPSSNQTFGPATASAYIVAAIARDETCAPRLWGCTVATIDGSPIDVRLVPTGWTDEDGFGCKPENSCNEGYCGPGVDGGGLPDTSAADVPVVDAGPADGGLGCESSDVLVCDDFESGRLDDWTTPLGLPWSIVEGIGDRPGRSLLSGRVLLSPAFDVFTDDAITIEFDFLHPSSADGPSYSYVALENDDVVLMEAEGDVILGFDRVFIVEQNSSAPAPEDLVTIYLRDRVLRFIVERRDVPLALRTWYHVHAAFCVDRYSYRVTDPSGATVVEHAGPADVAIPSDVDRMRVQLLSAGAGSSFDNVRVVRGCVE